MKPVTKGKLKKKITIDSMNKFGVIGTDGVAGSIDQLVEKYNPYIYTSNKFFGLVSDTKFKIGPLTYGGEVQDIRIIEDKALVSVSAVRSDTDLLIDGGIADADVIADSVIFSAKPGAFKTFSKGDTSSVELELHQGEEGLVSINATEEMKSRYPLEYLKKMIKASKLSEKATVEFGTDYPLRIGFINTDKISLKFVLAPRVED